LITYRSGKQNGKADILTRYNQDIESQNNLKTIVKKQTLFTTDQLDLRITATLVFIQLKTFMNLVDRILNTNRHSTDFTKDRNKVFRKKQNWLLENGLLF